nr:SapC family protein [Ruegeria arenilitoris]
MTQNGLFPVSRDRHQARYWQRFTSYGFARELSECPVIHTELCQIAAAFPIMFRKTRSGIRPFAVFSLTAGPVPFVSTQGRWLASYVPSILRCYPFSAEPLTDTPPNTNQPFRLLVDEASGLVTDDIRDEPFFTTDGTLTPDLCAVCAFFQSHTTANAATRRMCDIIDKMDLFKPLLHHDGIDLEPEWLGIDFARMEALSQPHKLLLMNNNALGLIHAHQVSLSHCAWVFKAQQKQLHRSPDAESPELNGFLCAMASAQQLEGIHADY